MIEIELLYASEFLKIIEAGLEGDTSKVRAYTKLLCEKLTTEARFKTAVEKRLDGSYKNMPKLQTQKEWEFVIPVEHLKRMCSKTYRNKKIE